MKTCKEPFTYASGFNTVHTLFIYTHTCTQFFPDLFDNQLYTLWSFTSKYFSVYFTLLVFLHKDSVIINFSKFNSNTIILLSLPSLYQFIS